MQNVTATLEDCLVVSYSIKHTLTKLSSTALLGFIQTSWKLLSAQNLHTDAYIHNWQNLKAIKCPPVGECTDKLVHPDSGILSSTANKWAIKPWKDMEETWMHITKWKKSTWKGCVLHGSNHMTSWKRQSYGNNKKIRGCQRLWGGWDE